MTAACGTRAAYMRHRANGETPCDPCVEAHRRYCKEYRWRTSNGTQMLSVDASEARALLDKANALGVSDYRMGVLSGVPVDTTSRVRRGVAATVHPSTIERLRASLANLEIPDESKVEADLTYWRVRSLMRQQWSRVWIAGQVGWTPATSGRQYPNVGAKRARAVRDLALEIGDKYGPAKLTGTHAQKAGWPPLAAWDDPGTLAWPANYPRPTLHPKADISYDEVAVLRRMAGDRSVRLRRRESEEVVRRLFAEGHSLRWIEQHTGLRTQRYVHVLDRQEGAA